MDALNEPAIVRVVMMTSAQIGKTEILNNASGFFIDYDPSPILVLQPTLEMSQAWSKDRLTPMLRDTPRLKGKVNEARSRDSGNTVLHKIFPGGHITMAGANSPASLASRPIRVVLADELDRYPISAGNEGDPLLLAFKRTNNFWNRKQMVCSTPTVKGLSRIEKEFELSDQRRFFVPCPHCGEMHTLQWGNVIWPKGKPEQARMKCPSCGALFTNAQKNAAVRLGQWRATAPFTGIAGFHLNEMYSPWRTITEIVTSFIEAKNDPSRLQVFINTSLGETWEEGGDSVSEHDLLNRCEAYAAEVPARGLILTAGVDTQQDRLEVEIVAWAGGEESWSIDYHVIHGDPDIEEGTPGSPWTDLTDYLRRAWKHESLGEMAVAHACIDSGGSNTSAVYNYVKAHRGERIYAIKGQGGDGKPIIGQPQRKRSGKKTKRPVDVYMVGVDPAKSTIYKRLRIAEPGPGYCHFPQARELEYFKQLTAEKMVVRFVKGFPKREWKKDEGRRNEALDCRVYAFAALVLAAPQFDKLAFRLRKQAKEAPPITLKEVKEMATPEQSPEPQPPPPEKPAPEPDPPPPKDPTAPKPRNVLSQRKRRRGGYVNAWR